MCALNRPRVALVGCGNLATRYYLPTLRAAHRQGRCRFEALCDVNAAVLDDRAQRFAVPRTYTDVAALLEGETLDGVLVVVPVDVTASVARLALSHGVPTYVEKPPGRTAAECRGLIRAAERGAAPNQVAFNRRYAPPLRLMRERMLRLGPIHSASAVMFRHARLEDEFIWSTGIHALDALRFLAGDVAQAQARRARLPGGRADGFIVDIWYVSGGMGTLEVMPDAGVSAERYVAHGPEATGFARVAGPGSCIDRPGGYEVYYRGQRVQTTDPFGGRRRVPVAEAAGFKGEILAFLDGLRSGRAPSPSLAESLPSLQVVEALSTGRSYRLR